jgi:hypothetical protein
MWGFGGEHKQIETMKDNKLIAEFMGAVGTPMYAPKEWDIYITGHLDVDSDNENAQHFFTPKEMKYHSSWDWLMPVVEKIESMNASNDPYYSDSTFQVTNFVQNWTASFLDRDNVEVVQEEGTTRFEAAYKAVVEFIKWYNEQNK